MKKSVYQHMKDLIFAPLRLAFLPDDISKKLGLTSLEGERLNAVLPFIKGKLLDIGCGRNTLVKLYGYGNGIGVDVYEWGGEALIVNDTSKLPFDSSSFDTVSIIAALNHIPNRKEVLREVNRILRVNGSLIITMINPLISYIGHEFLWWHGEHRTRGMEEGEVYGFWKKELVELLKSAGFSIIHHSRFLYGMNNIYIFRKEKFEDFGTSGNVRKRHTG